MNKNERRNYDELNGTAILGVIRKRSFEAPHFYFIRRYPQFSNLREVLSHMENTNGYNLTPRNRRSSALFVRACHAIESSVTLVD